MGWVLAALPLAGAPMVPVPMTSETLPAASIFQTLWLFVSVVYTLPLASTRTLSGSARKIAFGRVGAVVGGSSPANVLMVNVWADNAAVAPQSSAVITANL